MLLTKAISALLCGVLLTGCSGAPNEQPAAERSFRIVGYVTAAAVLDVIDFSRLTHVNHASAKGKGR